MRYVILLAALLLCLPVRGETWQVVGQAGSGITLTSDYTSNPSATRTSITLGKPANTADGDFLIAAIGTLATQTTPTPPSGWTLMASEVQSESGRGGLWVYYKRAASELENWTWTIPYGVNHGAVYRLSGVVSSGDPEDVANSVCQHAYSGDVLTCPAITTATAGAAVMMVATATNLAVEFTSHSLTQRAEVYLDSTSAELTIDADLQASAGTSGDQSVTPTSPTRPIGILLALKPQ